MTILAQLVAATKQRLARDQAAIPLKAMEALAAQQAITPFCFEQALQQEGVHFICEVKKASPSKGLIASDFPYVAIAREYAAAQASAISVLTETDYFLGHDRYLQEIRAAVSTPLLRKDFTLDPYQLYQARALGANAVLLICALLDTAKLREFIALADTLGLSALVEAHDENEVQSAVDAGARLIGVNNRDLKTFHTDLAISIRLRERVPENTVFIAESGIHNATDVARLRDHNIHAFLIGESLMRSNDKKAMLDSLAGRGASAS